MSDLINCTPHDVHVHLADGKFVTYPPSGTVVRMQSAEQVLMRTLDNGVPVKGAQQFTSVVDIPKGHAPIIVSMPVGQFLQQARCERHVYGPDTSPAGAIRDDQGRIVGTRGLVQYCP